LRPDKLPPAVTLELSAHHRTWNRPDQGAEKPFPRPTWAWTIFFRPFFDLDFVGFKRVTNRFQTHNKQVDGPRRGRRARRNDLHGAAMSGFCLPGNRPPDSLSAPGTQNRTGGFLTAPAARQGFSVLVKLCLIPTFSRGFCRRPRGQWRSWSSPSSPASQSGTGHDEALYLIGTRYDPAGKIAAMALLRPN
jgi:hypothetical protein